MIYRLKSNKLAVKICACVCRRLFFRIATILTFVVITVTIVLWMQPALTVQEKELKMIKGLDIHLKDDEIWFPRVGNNITGWPIDIVPNIVHYVLFGEHKISYVHMLSLFSVIKIHKPDTIYIHCDCTRMDDGDEHLERVLNLLNETNEITLYINEVTMPTEIYGKPLPEHWQKFHGSDITRYRTLMKYGGLYLDNDIFICQSLHKFRKFEFTLNWDEGQYLGSQVLMGNPNARFLKFVMETYKGYDSSQWYFNAGDLPTKAILWKYPHLVHRIKVKFGVDSPAACPFFYTEYHADWQEQFYTFHMVARGNKIIWKDWCLGVDKNHPMRETKIDDDLILGLNTTFGEMGRYVLFGSKERKNVTTGIV